MKNKFLKILANLEKKKNQKLYVELLKIYSEVANVRQVYHYQLGYTPTKFENLIYDIKKQFQITDKEVALYNPADDAEEETEEVEITNPISTPVAEVPNPVIEGLDEKSWQGLKLRDEYPFLNDMRTPDEYKILVADKISAYKNYAALHAEALQAADQGDAEDKLYELAKDAIKNYQLNIDIKDELDYYRDTEGKVLGKHPKLKDLKVAQEIDEMSEADLIKHRSNAMKALPKYKDGKNPEKYTEWTNRLTLTEKNLSGKFNYNFDKK